MPRLRGNRRRGRDSVHQFRCDHCHDPHAASYLTVDYEMRERVDRGKDPCRGCCHTPVDRPGIHEIRPATEARRRMLVLDAADRLNDLLIPPGNRLEKLVGERAGQYCIRINEQWRIYFRWRRGDAHEVEIVDYH